MRWWSVSGLAILFVGHVFAADAFLKASGTDLRSGSGTGSVVVLRGVNLGGWLNLEP